MSRMAHWIMGLLAIMAVVASMACTSSGSQNGTAQPTTSAPKPIASATSKSTEAAPSAGKAATDKPSVGADWKAEWDKTVAAAKQEGKVVVAGGAGDLYRKAATAFQAAYPDIKLEFSGGSGSEFGPKLIAERRGGQFLWDVHQGGGTTMLSVLKPNGALDPLKPALILPEILDDSKWLGGFDVNWMDKEHQYVYGFEGRVRYTAFANRDLAPESQLNSMDQLLEPKWKGKIVLQDPRVSGPAGPCSGYLYTVKGEDWLRKLYAQEPVVMKDARQAAEAVVRGSYPIGMCLDSAQLELLVQQGVAGQVKPLDTQSEAGTQITGGFGNVALINRAPHPNAARVYLNWLLSQDGQRNYTATTNLNSRRLDVQGPAETAPNPNMKYPDMQKEEFLPNLEAAKNIAIQMFK